MPKATAVCHCSCVVFAYGARSRLSQPLSAVQPCLLRTDPPHRAASVRCDAEPTVLRCAHSVTACGCVIRTTGVQHTRHTLVCGAPVGGLQARLDQLFDELCSSEAKYAEFLLVGVMQAAAAPPSAASQAACRCADAVRPCQRWPIADRSARVGPALCRRRTGTAAVAQPDRYG